MALTFRVKVFLVLLVTLLCAGAAAFPMSYVLRSRNELVISRRTVHRPRPYMAHTGYDRPNVAHHRPKRQITKVGKCPYGMIWFYNQCVYEENGLVVSRRSVHRPRPYMVHTGYDRPNVVHHRSKRQMLKHGRCPEGMIWLENQCVSFEEYETKLKDYD